MVKFFNEVLFSELEEIVVDDLSFGEVVGLEVGEGDLSLF